MVLSEINIYPIKSLGGISLTHAQVEERGLQYDRRWMLIDEQNQFLTQRKYPHMALIKVAIGTGGLQTFSPDMPSFTVPFLPETMTQIQVSVWDDYCDVVVVSNQANEWFSEALQVKCRLVYMPEETFRSVDEKYDPGHNTVSFADGFPFLLISEASLADLNSRLDDPIPMNRFRPNLVIRNTEPFAEDQWKQIQIGKVRFHVVKPCARCIMTTINQDTAKKGKEPLRTLATYRTVNNKILFGQNLVYEKKGKTIQLGDEVQVIGFHSFP